MKQVFAFLFVFLSVAAMVFGQPIDRMAVVSRHNIESNEARLLLPLGNGNFCISVDGTGLQTFGGNIMSHDGWHNLPLPESFTMEDVPETGSFQRERCKGGDKALPDGFEPLRQWMVDNPHRANLGRIRLMRTDGIEIKPEQITNLKRKLDLWTGIHQTEFEIDGAQVNIQTFVTPDNEILLNCISPLFGGKKLEVVLDFPYPTEQNGRWVGNFDVPEKHTTSTESYGGADGMGFGENWKISRNADDLSYTVCVRLEAGDANGKRYVFQDLEKHQMRFSTKSDFGFLLMIAFREPKPGNDDDFDHSMGMEQKLRLMTMAIWRNFWQSGGVIDLSGSTDPRWLELERRIVLSQYLMRCNAAGNWPPAECGLLTTDPWRGRFHLEMIWWHLAHYALWNRLECSDEALKCYEKFKPVAKQLAEQLGYRGYKWGKCVGPEGRTAPWGGNLVLLWKQPHPMFFAELEYRNRPTPQTLEKWADILEGTAEHMVDYAIEDEHGVFHLDPVMPPSEVGISRNTVFDLTYWRFGLDIANRWRERMGKPRNAEWDNVRKKLAVLPAVDDPEDGKIYARSVHWLDEFSKRNWEHPDMAGVFGMLPLMDGVDPAISKRTIDKMKREWNWSKCWGWDFPWIAMSFVRNGDPDGALDMLLHDSPQNRYDERGVNLGGPCPYLPGNGGLLYVVAMMTAGWDGAPEGNAPGFPNNGKWNVKHEGLKQAP